MAPVIGVAHLGLCRYRHAVKIQNAVAERFKQRLEPGLDGVLLLLEHPPVYTVGIRKNALKEHDVEKLKRLGADVENAGRGGLVTFHGPGQLVAWPILDLKSFSSIRNHVFSLEESVIQTCQKFGLSNVARDSAYPGVWRDDGKLCAVGVRASRSVTTHGLALNVSNDLTWFEQIVPCGIPDKHVTSLSQELGTNVEMEEVIHTFLNSFSNVFASELVGIPKSTEAFAENA